MSTAKKVMMTLAAALITAGGFSAAQAASLASDGLDKATSVNSAPIPCFYVFGGYRICFGG